MVKILHEIISAHYNLENKYCKIAFFESLIWVDSMD